LIGASTQGSVVKLSQLLGGVAHADLIVLAVGAIVVLIGRLLPYAYLPSGPVGEPKAGALVFLTVTIALWVIARHPVGRWPARVGGALMELVAGYSTVVVLRSIPTWAGVYYEMDGTPGPAIVVETLGLTLAVVAVFLRSAR
jgi:hypothetical protein